MAETTNKVTPETEPTAEGQPTAEQTTDEKKGSTRIDFPLNDALYRDKENNVVSAVNGDGLLIAVPKPIKDENGSVVYAGFNTRKHNPLKKGDFADLPNFMLHQAFVARVRAAILLKSAEDKEVKAARMAKFGDEETRKKVQKMARMKEQLAALEQQLKDDGVDTSDIS